MTPELVIVPAAAVSARLTLPRLDVNVLALVTELAAVSARLPLEVIAPPVVREPVVLAAVKVLPAVAVVLKLATFKVPELAVIATFPEAVPEFGSCTNP